MKSYSQYGEDRIVASLFGSDEIRKWNGHDCALLDIGAWGPRDLSNSRAFIELGWNAVLVEFSPKPVRELVEAAASDWPRVHVVAAAVTPVHQHCLEFRVTDDALSAGEHTETFKQWSRKTETNPGGGGYYGRLWVPTVPLKDLINQFFHDKPLDYVSIDTEGTSVDLLLELFALGRRPRAIVCEHDGRDTQIWEACKQARYTVRDRNETNVILEALA